MGSNKCLHKSFVFKGPSFIAPREEEISFFFTEIDHVQTALSEQRKNFSCHKLFGVLQLNCLPDPEIVSLYENRANIKAVLYILFFFVNFDIIKTNVYSCFSCF